MSTPDASGPPVPSTAVATPDRRFLPVLLGIAVGALVVRVLVIVLVDPQVPRLGDASAYHLLANHLADGRGYIRPFDLTKFGLVVPTAEYPPLHPFVVSLLARAGLRSVQAQRIGLAFVGAGTVGLVGLVGRRVAGRWVGWVAAGIAALSPMFFLPEATLMSETVFVFLVTLALLLTLRLRDAVTPWRVAALGGVLGLAVLTRAEAAVLGLLLLAPLLRGGTRSVGARIGLVAVGLGVMVAVVVPWTARNQSTFHHLVPVSNNLGTALAGANCDLTYSGRFLGSWRSTFATGDVAAGRCFTGFNGRQRHFNEAVAAGAARRQGIDFARDHVGDLPQVAITRVLRTFGLFRAAQQIQLEALEGRPTGWERAGTWIEWLLYPLAIGGFVVLVRGRRPWWPLMATVVTVVVASLLTYGNQRFRIAAEPAIAVTAAVAIVGLTRWGTAQVTVARR